MEEKDTAVATLQGRLDGLDRERLDIRERLNAIERKHHGKTPSGNCPECGKLWPCPTFNMARGAA